MGGAVWYRARAELRQRWRALVALTLLVALATGVVLTAAAGARRTDSSYRRLLAASASYDVEVQVIGDLDPAVLDQVAALPQVAERGQIVILPADAAEDPAAPARPFGWGLSAGAIVDGHLGVSFEKARVVAGRGADLDDPTEAVVSEAFLTERGLSVGDRFSFHVLTAPEMFRAFGGREVTPSLSPFTITIVGVWRLPHDVSFVTTPGGMMYLTPGFYRAHAADLATLPLLYVRLHPGADQDAFVAAGRAIAREAGDPDGLSFGSQSQLVRDVQRSLTVQAIALWLFAGLTALASLLVAGQAIARQLHLAADDAPVLRALGFPRSRIVGTHLVHALVPAAGGAVLGAVIAVLASPLMPIGIARPIEPTPGFAVDWVVLVLGVAVAAASFVLAALPAAVRLARRSSHGTAETRPVLGSARRIARAGAGPAAVVGVHLALSRGGRRAAVPVRASIGGAVAGIAALVAAFTFGTSFDHLLDTPAEYGWNWDVVVAGGEVGSPEDRAFVEDKARQAAARPQAAAAATLTVRHASAAGSEDLTIFTFQDLKGSVQPRLLEGRLPSGPDELAAGSAVLDANGASMGDALSLPGTAEACGGEDCTLRYETVGRIVSPQIDGTQQNDGIVVTPGGGERIAASAGFVDVVVRLADGITLEEARVAFGGTSASRKLDPSGTGGVRTAQRSVELENLTRVRGMPMVLAGSLALLTLGALAHSLLLSVRRRRHELAILKTIGFVRRQVAGAVAWQATTLVVIALLAASPIGIVAGRWSWEQMNGALGVGVAPIVPVSAIAAGAAVLIVVANLVAALPARAAARTQPAIVLRSE